MKLEIIKSHGSGNDFILIDIRNKESLFTDSVKSRMTIELCKRKGSIGADGILFIENSKIADCKMRIFNSDGSEAQMCGNGIRIVARFISEYKNSNSVTIENITGLSYLVEKKEDFFKNIIAYQVSFPTISFKTSDLPIVCKNEYLINEKISDISNKYYFTAISMPNPHLITNTNNIDIEELKELGIKINLSRGIIPNGANLSFVKSIDDDNIYVVTYERGVGITNSCGTAMCASIISAVKNNYLSSNKEIRVINKGGYVLICVNKDYSCRLIGNATYVFSATIDFDIDGLENIEFFKGNAFVNEIMDYGELIDFSRNLLIKNNIQ